MSAMQFHQSYSLQYSDSKYSLTEKRNIFKTLYSLIMIIMITIIKSITIEIVSHVIGTKKLNKFRDFTLR